METHGQDPTTAEDVDPWDAVTAEARALSQKLRETYRHAAGEVGPTEDDVRDAFATLAGAWNQVAESVGEALRDNDVRRRIKQTVSAIATAVGSTISGLGSELGEEE